MEAVDGVNFVRGDSSGYLRNTMRSMVDSFMNDANATSVDTTSFVQGLMATRGYSGRRKQLQAFLYVANGLRTVRRRRACPYAAYSGCNYQRKKVAISPAALGLTAAFYDSRLRARVHVRSRTSPPPRKPFA